MVKKNKAKVIMKKLVLFLFIFSHTVLLSKKYVKPEMSHEEYRTARSRHNMHTLLQAAINRIDREEQGQQGPRDIEDLDPESLLFRQLENLRARRQRIIALAHQSADGVV